MQYALQLLRTRAAQAEAAAADGGLAGSSPGERPGSGSGSDDAAVAALWRLVRETPLSAAPLLTFMNVKVGASVPGLWCLGCGPGDCRRGAAVAILLLLPLGSVLHRPHSADR